MANGVIIPSNQIKYKDIIIPYQNTVWCQYYEANIRILSVIPIGILTTMGNITLGGTSSSVAEDAQRVKIHFPSGDAPLGGVKATILYINA
jgi:hypothetical protein